MESHGLPEYGMYLFFKFSGPKVNSVLEKRRWASTDPSISVQVNKEDCPRDREHLCWNQGQAYSSHWALPTLCFYKW